MLVSNMVTYVSVATHTENTTSYLIVNATRFVLETIVLLAAGCGETKSLKQVGVYSKCEFCVLKYTNSKKIMKNSINKGSETFFFDMNLQLPKLCS